jgi:hypothetical protein
MDVDNHAAIIGDAKEEGARQQAGTPSRRPMTERAAAFRK